MKPESLQEDQPSEQLLTGENPSRSLIARPDYFLTADASDIPFHYWRNNLSHKDHVDSPFYEKNRNFLSEKHNVGTTLISIFNADGHAGVKVSQFLQDHYDAYCDDLKADEDVTPFFEYLVSLVKTRKDEFSRKPYKAILNWVNTHDDYIPHSHPTTTLEGSLISLYDKPNNLSLRQIAVIMFYQGLKPNSANVEKLLANSEHQSKAKLIQRYNEFKKDSSLKPSTTQGKQQSSLLDDFLAAYVYLSGDAKKAVGNEIHRVDPEIILPV